MRAIRAYCGILFVTSFLLVAHIDGIPQSTAKKQTPNSGKTNQHKSNTNKTEESSNKGQLSTGLLDIKISTSRKEVTLDAAYGLFAEVENTSTVPITIYTEQTILVVQPEVTRGAKCSDGVRAYFPTAFAPGQPYETGQHVIPVPDPLQTSDPRGLPITIQPKEHYTIFWNANQPSFVTDDKTGEKKIDPCTVSHWYDVFSFAPGEYAFVVDAKLYLTSNQKEETVYHTITEKTFMRVGITQLTAMFASMFGAVIAYWVTSLRPDRDFGRFRESKGPGALLRIVRNFFSAALMGATITIVSSRLADTQFPIKVSVNDFWGAVTIGFISYFVGDKFIDKLVGSVKGHPPDTPSTTKSVA